MATYLLIHGACWGGICWGQVETRLRDRGHEVFAPTLTGLGERAHLASPEIDLDVHIGDIVGVLEYYDLRSVTLVGHSYGGTVVTGAADRCIDRIAQLVFLDAHAPRNGESWADLLDSEDTAQVMDEARRLGDGWRLPPGPGATPFMRAQPLKTFTQRISLRHPNLHAVLPCTFIECVEPRLDAISKSVERAKAEGWNYYEMPTGHMAMLTMPNELTDILLELA
jgi:pimeloyl-ACP methyl ester carboxylesterase